MICSLEAALTVNLIVAFCFGSPGGSGALTGPQKGHKDAQFSSGQAMVDLLGRVLLSFPEAMRHQGSLGRTGGQHRLLCKPVAFL